MNLRAEALAQEAIRFASQIRSLALAANCILTGDMPTDRLEAKNAALDLLDLIGELAGSAEHDVEALEKLCGGTG